MVGYTDSGVLGLFSIYLVEIRLARVEFNDGDIKHVR